MTKIIYCAISRGQLNFLRVFQGMQYYIIYSTEYEREREREFRFTFYQHESRQCNFQYRAMLSGEA